MHLVSRIVATALLICGAAAAQDFTGRWAGAADSTDEAGTKRNEKQSFDIKLEDGKLVAVQVNRNGNGGSPLDIQTDGNKVNLYRYLTLDGGEHLRWKFELKDGKLVGSFSAQHNSPKKWIYDRIGAMTLTKETAPATPTAAK